MGVSLIVKRGTSLSQTADTSELEKFSSLVYRARKFEKCLKENLQFNLILFINKHSRAFILYPFAYRKHKNLYLHWLRKIQQHKYDPFKRVIGILVN